MRTSITNCNRAIKTDTLCRALIAIRRKKQGDATYMFRSYSHNDRFATHDSELNPGKLRKGGGPKIWEACRASTAAPLYFKHMVIDDQYYMDGGVGNNNPADLAWNEARWMWNRWQPENGEVKALVSLGTGTAHAESRFGLTNLLRWSRRSITETARVHAHIQNLASGSEAKYWRFDVKPESTEHDGLARMKLNECKRTRLWRKQPSNRDRAKSPTSSASDDTQWHRDLQLEAMEDDRKARKTSGWRSGYRPDKYRYDTFDRIFKETEHYCTNSRFNDGTYVEAAIDRCAEFLYKAALDRWERSPQRFRRFVSHPHPKHRDYLQPLPSKDENGEGQSNLDSVLDEDGEDSGVEGLQF